MWYHRRSSRLIGWLVIDGLLLAGALALAYQLAFDFDPSTEYSHQFRALLGPVVVVELVLLWLFGLYNRMIRFAGVGEILVVAGGLAVALLMGLLYFLILRAVERTPGNPELAPWAWPIPRSVLGINWLTATAAAGGVRMVRRLSQAWPAGMPSNARRALIVGATDVGDFAVRMLRRSPLVGLRPVAFLDESGMLAGRTIQGLPIVGALSDLAAVLRDWHIDEVLIAMPMAEAATINRVVEDCRRADVAVRVLPGENELIAGRRTLGGLRPVDASEVLGRQAADLTIDESLNYVRGEVVLVTGAGGSIGSELCRQIIALGPAKLLMLGRGENSLFELEQRLGARAGRSCHVIVADVRDEPKLARLFAEHRPAVIFHAAAHKHVPLMEDAPDEAVKNNILATDLLARLAHEHGAKRFVLISTDKAVRPTSIMGASKRVAEQIIVARAGQSVCRFVAVRFGNVLGSRGSVVPIFRRQIEHGGPVTITHPDAERYFMTVQEAVSLVLRAGAVAESGQLCVLDMGQPVKIVDLARNLITLSGLEPGRDIEIVHTGLRPGEKLKEEYLSTQEGLEKTVVGKVFVTRPERPDPDALRRDLDALRDAAASGDLGEIQRLMRARVPDYRHS